MLFTEEQKMVDIIAINWANTQEYQTFKVNDFIGIANYGRNVREVVGFRCYTIVKKNNTLREFFKKIIKRKS